MSPYPIQFVVLWRRNAIKAGVAKCMVDNAVIVVKHHNRRFRASMPWPQSDFPQRPHHELWSWIRPLLINTAPSVPPFSSSILRISSALSSLIFESWILHVMKPWTPNGMIPCTARLVVTTTSSCLATHCFSQKALSNLSVTSTKRDMGQILRRLSQPELPPHGVVGGIWSDHELVLVPLEVSSHRLSIGSILAESVSSSPSTSESTTSTESSVSASSYFTTSSPDPAEGALETSPSGSSSAGSRQVDTFDREDLIITRTVIRPATQTPIRGMFLRPSSPMVSRPTSPHSRPNTPVFQALNCFRPSAFEREVDDMQTERAMVAAQPVLQVIVTQTREQYEQDLAFKEVVQEVYPEASRHGRRLAVR